MTHYRGGSGNYFCLYSVGLCCGMLSPALLAHMVSKGESLDPANIIRWAQTLPLLALERGQGPEHILCMLQTAGKTSVEKGMGSFVHVSRLFCLSEKFELIFGLRVILLLETDKTRMTQE